MPLASRNLVTEVEFGAEQADQRVGWSAITGHGRRPDEVLAIHIVNATIGEDGAKLEYEPKEEDGKPIKSYWSDAARGFIAAAGISVVIDTAENPDRPSITRPYWSFNEGIINGTSAGNVLRLAGNSISSADEIDELDTKKVWANSAIEAMTDVKQSMAGAGLERYYPVVYYTANVLLGHIHYRGDTEFGKIPPEAALMPDAEMGPLTKKELAKADTIVENLSTEDQEDKAMLRNLSVFGEVPAKDIPQAFRASREKVAAAEQRVIAADQELYTRAGLFLPIGYRPGGRSWPYMDASKSPDDDAAFSMELERLSKGKPKIAQSELERERDELKTRIIFAKQGVSALELLSQAEVKLQTT